MAQSRPFTLRYHARTPKRKWNDPGPAYSLKMTSHASTPEGVLRAVSVRLFSGFASHVEVLLDDELFAEIYFNEQRGAIYLDMA